jgi:ASC-1-like (ASCH) protein
VASAFKAQARSAPDHAIKKPRDRRSLERKGTYSRFIECNEKGTPTRKQGIMDAATHQSLVSLPVEGPALAECPLDGWVSARPEEYAPADRTSIVRWMARRLRLSGLDIDQARRMLANAFPVLHSQGIDMVGVYYEAVNRSRCARLQAFYEEHFPRLSDRELCEEVYSFLGEWGEEERQDEETEMCSLAAVSACVDLFEPEHTSAMIQLLHSAQGNIAAAIKAESELISTTVYRLACSAEGVIRMFQFWWRLRIVGLGSKKDDRTYWSIVHSTKKDSRDRLLKFCHSKRNDVNMRGHAVKRWFTFDRDSGKMVALKTPIITYANRYVELCEKTGRSFPRGGGARRTTEGAVVILKAVDGLSAIRRAATGADVERDEDGAKILDAEGKPRTRALDVSPFRFLHRHRPVRKMRCGYGALACLHTVRDKDGKAVLKPDGRPLRRRWMATQTSFTTCTDAVRTNIRWYSAARVLLEAAAAAAGRKLLLALLYGEPGGGGEAALKAGLDAVLVDRDTKDSGRYFGEVAPQLYGKDGAIIHVIKDDVLTPGARERAFVAHPRADDLWLVYSTPPCVRGSTAVELAAKQDARKQEGDRPPARGDYGKKGAREETLSEEIAINQREYENNRQMYFVETTAGTLYEQDDSVNVTEIDELMYGCRIQGKHKIYSPMEHPLHLDDVFFANIQALRPVTCPGASRPIQPRQLAGGSPMKPSCCEGQLGCGFNNGYFIYDKAAIAKFIGTHPEHVTSRHKQNNVLPVIIQEHHQAQGMAWSANIRFGIPFVTFDAGIRDNRLAAWWLGLLEHAAQCIADGAPAQCQVKKVLLVIAPANKGGQVIVDKEGALPFFSVPTHGKFTDEVVQAFEKTNKDVRIFAERLAFVQDGLNEEEPYVVMFTQSISCNDAYFLERSSVLHLAEMTQVRHKREKAALREAGRLSLIEPLLSKQVEHCVVEPQVTISDELLQRAVDLLTPGAVESLATGQARTARKKKPTHKEEALDNGWDAPEGTVLLTEPIEHWQHDRRETAAEVFVGGEGSAADSSEEMRLAYVKRRQELMGKANPAKYGLGTRQRDSLSDPSNVTTLFPQPVNVDAVGLLIKWRGKVIVTPWSDTQFCVLHKALVATNSKDPRTGKVDKDTEVRQLRRELNTLLGGWLCGRELGRRTEDLVGEALRGDHTVEEWIIPSRDSTGLMLSTFTPPTRVKMRTWIIRLPDNTDWSVMSSVTRSTPLYMPRLIDGGYHLRQHAETEGEQAKWDPPASPSQIPYEHGILMAVTADAFAAEYIRLHIDHIRTTIRPAEAAVSEWAAVNTALASLDQAMDDSKDGAEEAEVTTESTEAAVNRATAELALVKAGARMMAASRFARRTMCEGLGGFPMMVLYLAGTVQRDIIQGRKTVESRLAWGDYAKVTAGWLLCFKSHAQSPAIFAVVRGVTRHDSFHEAARHHGRALFPHMSVDAMSDVEIEYECFKLYHGNRTPTRDTLREWMSTVQRPRCIICWSIQVLCETMAMPVTRKFGTLITQRGRPIHPDTGRGTWRRLAAAVVNRRWEVIYRAVRTLAEAGAHTTGHVPPLMNVPDSDSDSDSDDSDSDEDSDEEQIVDITEAEWQASLAACRQDCLALNEAAREKAARKRRNEEDLAQAATIIQAIARSRYARRRMLSTRRAAIRIQAMVRRRIAVTATKATELKHASEQERHDAAVTIQRMAWARCISKSVRLIYTTCPDGLRQKELQSDKWFILNATTYLQEKVTTDVEVAFPHAVTPRCGREPGKIVVRQAPNEEQPNIINLHVGTPVGTATHHRTEGVACAQRHRIERIVRFRDCMEAVGAEMKPGARIVVPREHICDTQSEWPAWKRILRDFALKHARLEVRVIYKASELTKQVIKSVRTSAREQSRKARQLMAQETDKSTRKIGLALVAALEQQCLESVPEGNLADPKSIAEAASAAIAGAEDDVAKAKQQMAEEHQALTDVFHAQVRAGLEDGTISADDVRKAAQSEAGTVSAAARIEGSARRRRVVLGGLKDARYNGCTGTAYVTPNDEPGSRVKVELDDPLPDCLREINVKMEYVFDDTSAQSLAGLGQL